MKVKNLITSGVLAAVLAALAVNSAKAGNTPTYAVGDWLLGFYDSAVSKQYIIDIGPHTGNSSFLISTSTSGIGTDLAAAFSESTWQTDSNVFFGAIGTNASNGIFWTNPSDDGGFKGGGGSSDHNLVDTVGGNSTGAQQSSPTPASAGIIQSTGLAGGWYQELAAGNSGSLGNNLQNDFGSGDTYISDNPTNALEMDFVNSTNTVEMPLGSFSVDSVGDITYTTAAVPEPSTFAAIGLGAVVLAFARRRRA